MKFIQLISSSLGNAYIVESETGYRLLIECGASWKKMLKLLDFKLDNVRACLVSHEHKDHSEAISEAISNGMDVWASKETFRATCVELGPNCHTLRKYSIAKISPEFKVLPFSLYHDCPGALGFVVHCDNETMLFAPDTKLIKTRFGCSFSIIALECSWDEDILKKRVENKDINETLAKRLLESHMSKQTAMSYIDNFCDLSNCREIHILHLSKNNIDAEKTRLEFEEKFFVKTVICK